MKILKSLIIMSLILMGCSSNISWEVKEGEYKSETFLLEDNYTEALVISRNQNVNSNEKSVSFTFYLTTEGIVIFGIAYAYGLNTIDEQINNLTALCENKLHFEIDEYFNESVKDLLVNKVEKVREIFVGQELYSIVKDNKNLKLKITLADGQIFYEEWDGKTYNIENGTNDNQHIESKSYLGYKDAHDYSEVFGW